MTTNAGTPASADSIFLVAHSGGVVRGSVYENGDNFAVALETADEAKPFAAIISGPVWASKAPGVSIEPGANIFVDTDGLITSDTGETAVGGFCLRLAGTPEDAVCIMLGQPAPPAVVGLTGFTGASNTGLGTGAGDSITSGADNVAIGKDAATGITTGSNNVAIGSGAMAAATTASARNVVIGRGAAPATNTDGNVVIGDLAGTGVTTGGGNVVVGQNAGAALTTGEHNVIVGASAGYSVGTQSSNVIIGYGASTNAAPTRTIIIGHGAATNLAGVDNTIVGQDAGNELAAGTSNLLLGRKAGEGLGDVSNTCAIGSTTVPVNTVRVVSADAEGAKVQSPLSFRKPTYHRAFIVDIVPLADGANIATDAALGSEFSVTLADSRTMDNPTNPIAGQRLTYRLTQGGAGSCLVTWDTAFHFGTDVASPTLSTVVGKVDYITFEYNGSAWDCLAWARGY